MEIAFWGMVFTFTWWTAVGFTGQLFFSMRFIVQWIASERVRKSVVPVAFWYFSMFGGATLFIYAIHREDPVFILGQGMGLVIYARNLYFVIREHKEKKLMASGPDHTPTEDDKKIEK